MYIILKHSHLLVIAIAFIVFFVRGILMIRNSNTSSHKFFKIAPHILYLLLIGTGIGLAIQQNISPSAQPWLQAKLFALVLFILLGVFAFKHSKPTIRTILWSLALVVFAYMASVAQSKNVLGFFAAFL
jgi:uncharacterized membrane protein SirB2